MGMEVPEIIKAFGEYKLNERHLLPNKYLFFLLWVGGTLNANSEFNDVEALSIVLVNSDREARECYTSGM